MIMDTTLVRLGGTRVGLSPLVAADGAEARRTFSRTPVDAPRPTTRARH